MNASVPKPLVISADSQSAPERGRPARSGRRTLQAFAAVMVVVAVGTFAAWWITEGQFIESTDDAYVQGDIVLLSPRIEGSVAAVLVTDNQTVHASQPLILLDASDWQTRLEQAKAHASEASAAAETAQRQLVQQQAAIDAAQAAVSQAQAEQTRAAAEAARCSGGCAFRDACACGMGLAPGE
jgi:membrane fusion protein, multidrug efflux system